MDFTDLTGKVLDSVEVLEERIIFYLTDGSAYESVHMQDCCERVYVERVEGNLDDLKNTKVIGASEFYTQEPKPDELYYDSDWTWTIQEILTDKGRVKFIWFGTSNGYYGIVPYFGITHGKSI